MHKKHQAAPAIRDRIVSLERVQAKDLVANPKNWRTHPEPQRKALRAMLEEVGYAAPLVARKLKDGKLELIDGHLRADSTPDETVPVVVLDVTAEEGDKLIATMDPIGAMATRDQDKLAELLGSMQFGSDAIKAMLERLQSIPWKGRTDPDAAPAIRETGIMPGDVFALGSHRLMCGSSIDAIPVSELLAGERPMLMATDPPYGVDYDPEWRKRAGINNSDNMGRVENDDVADWTPAWKLFTGSVAYVWHGGLHAAEVVQSLAAADLEVRAQIVWAKPRIVIGRGHYHWQHEPCWYTVRKGKQASWRGDRTQSTLWAVARTEEATGHSTQKPVELWTRAILNHTEPKASVYEPFCGSGTAIIACERLERRCFAMEISPKYVQVAIDRWEAFTGKKAEKL